MALGIVEWSILIITAAFGILVILFLLQTFIKRRSAWSILISLVLGFLAGLVAIINELWFADSFVLNTIFQSLHLNLYGFHFFFFYIFFEQLISKKFNSIRLSIMIGLILLQTIGLWSVIYYRLNSISADLAWVLADIGNWTPAIFVYTFGIIIYIKTYIYTKEIKPILFCIALIFVDIGFIISFLNDYYFIANVFGVSLSKPDIIDFFGSIGNVFPSVGIIMFVITYLVDINYIYRLPNDIYLLMVLTKVGTPLHTVKLKTRKKIRIEEVLLSGMISAINSVFKEIFKKDTVINEISSEGISIIMKAGDNILSLVITDKPTYFLEKALSRYVKAFEKEFEKEIKSGIKDLVVFDRAIDLLHSIFPFFIIEKSGV
ncbi:MAG: hypothetical protein ACTSRP_00620 [Candidatus Helarchaeota archaeon]